MTKRKSPSRISKKKDHHRKTWQNDGVVDDIQTWEWPTGNDIYMDMDHEINQ